MTATHQDSGALQAVATRGRFTEAAHLQAIEGTPLSPHKLVVREVFAREGWPIELASARMAPVKTARGRFAKTVLGGGDRPAADEFASRNAVPLGDPFNRLPFEFGDHWASCGRPHPPDAQRRGIGAGEHRRRRLPGCHGRAGLPSSRGRAQGRSPRMRRAGLPSRSRMRPGRTQMFRGMRSHRDSAVGHPDERRRDRPADDSETFFAQPARSVGARQRRG